MKTTVSMIVAVGLICGLAACSGSRENTAETPAAIAQPGTVQSGMTQAADVTSATVATASLKPGPKYWAALLVAGDDSVPVFDNGVERMRGLLTETNVTAMRTLTSNYAKGRPEDIATAATIDQSLAALPQQADTGCFVFMTSHGGHNGMLLTNDLDSERILTPGALGRLLDAHCGARPTVAIISACYSGIFLDDTVEAPNRIILTAARSDRPSFGCGEGNDYTYYDACMLESWQKVHSFRQLYERTARCVRNKEAALKVRPSEPQAYFGPAIGDVPLPR